MDTITFDEAMRIMQQVDSQGNPVPFAIKVPTCDLTRNRGGEWIIYPAAVLCNTNPGSKVFHYRNDVRNIKAVGTKEPRAIHPILITEINGKTVTL